MEDPKDSLDALRNELNQMLKTRHRQIDNAFLEVERNRRAMADLRNEIVAGRQRVDAMHATLRKSSEEKPGATARSANVESAATSRADVSGRARSRGEPESKTSELA
jgi:hypothetical protein